MRLRKIIAIILTICTSTSVLVACNSSTVEKKLETEESSTYGLTISQHSFPDGVNVATTQFGDKNSIYIGGFNSAGEPVLGRLESNKFKALELPSDVEYVYSCCCSDDGLAVIAGDCPKIWTDHNGIVHRNDNDVEQLYLLTYKSNGQQISCNSLDNLLYTGENFFSIRYFENNYYLLSSHRFVQIDETGKVINELSYNGSEMISQCVTKKGIVLCWFYSDIDGGDNVVRIQSLSKEEFKFDTIFSSQDIYIKGLGYSTDTDEIVITADGCLYRLNKNGELEQIFNFSHAGTAVWEYTDIFSVNGDYLISKQNQKDIVYISYGKLEKARTKLTLWATIDTPAVINLVENFNRSNSDYVVVIEDISNLDESIVRTRMISGEGPDIYAMFGDGYLSGIEQKNVFENLLPLLESDEQYNSDSVVQSIRTAVMNTGGLYILPIDFMIWSFCYNKEFLNEEIALGKELETIAENPDIQLFPSFMTKSVAWYWISNLYLGTHLNNQNNTCNFMTEDFISLLNCCAKIKDNTNNLDTQSLINFIQLSNLRGLENLGKKYGNSYELRNGMGSAFSIQQSLAISKTSQHKEAAWMFIRQVLSANYNMTSDLYLPASKLGLESMVNKGLDGNLTDLITGEYVSITEYDANQLYDLINTTTCSIDAFPQITQIMKEEAEKTFSGDRSAEGTAKIIQSRVNIYLSEKNS